MRRNIYHITALTLLAFSLQGCGAMLALRGLEGNGYCPPNLHEQANYTYHYLNSISPNTHINSVVQTIGLPEMRTNEILSNNKRVEVWHYRTGNSNCRGLPTKEDFSPLVIISSRVQGGGLHYYQKNVGPYVVQRYQMTTGNKAFKEIGGLMYPFNKAF